MRLVRGFQWGTLNIAKLNQTSVCIIPKKRKPQTVKEYRPISLINCVYKIITKVLANRNMRLVVSWEGNYQELRLLLVKGVISWTVWHQHNRFSTGANRRRKEG
jgi:hypothetical protein